MNQSDLKSHLATIEGHLRHGNEFGKMNALKAFQRLFIEESLSKLELAPFIEIFTEEIKQSKNLYFSELVNTICLVGQQRLSEIEKFLPQLANMLFSDDSYLIKPILRLLAAYATTSNKKIHEIISNLIQNSSDCMRRADLQEAYEAFFRDASANGFGFLQEYRSYLEDQLLQYEQNFPSIFILLSKYIEDYQNFLEVEATRKTQIQQEIDEKQKKREQIRKRRAEIIINLEEDIINSQAEVKNFDIENPKPKQKIDSTSNSYDPKNPNFVSFSKLGLKKKESKK